MQRIIESGLIVDLILVLVMIEVLALSWFWSRTRSGVRPVSLTLNIGAGVSLMLALRASLQDAAWTWIAVALVAALIFHVADLAARWQRAGV